ncbi:hypothetical protein [Thiobacillus sp.]|uniref:hypothetical protein n=1 Tax=Thiobacillus sp. TaxID=924 RepID=UPI001810B273|nr:hypothetical protein [Thiobacillus sp.]MBC2732606.1 hypothetical protein [Thiobacillus sp.]MBC2741343.1 hypothetical protein [Thiobacillus sp.]MBC2759120.1 hypothetical protein [Thiobacillus sp.]
MRRFLRYLWALPVTLLGVLVALAARGSGGAVRQVEGVLEAAGGWPAWVLRRGFPFSGPVAAITLGHVVLGVSSSALAATRMHERAHVRQFERWGVLLLMLYPLAGMFAWLRGGNPYRDNLFEREARTAEAAGQGVSVRSWMAEDQSTGR